MQLNVELTFLLLIFFLKILSVNNPMFSLDWIQFNPRITFTYITSSKKKIKEHLEFSALIFPSGNAHSQCYILQCIFIKTLNHFK